MADVTFCLICSGILLIAISLACWIANAKPIEDWSDMHELEYDAPSDWKDSNAAQKRNAVCVTVQSLQRPQVQEAEIQAVADSRTAAGKPP